MPVFDAAVVYCYPNNNPPGTHVRDVLATLGYSKQDQPCKSDVLFAILRPETPVANHPELADYIIAPEDVPAWVSDCVGSDPKTCTIAGVRNLIRESNWQDTSILNGGF